MSSAESGIKYEGAVHSQKRFFGRLALLISIAPDSEGEGECRLAAEVVGPAMQF